MCIFRKKQKPTIEIPQLPKFIEGEEISKLEISVSDLIQTHRQKKGLKIVKNE